MFYLLMRLMIDRATREGVKELQLLRLERPIEVMGHRLVESL